MFLGTLDFTPYLRSNLAEMSHFYMINILGDGAI
jgi:hypothetical protein